MAEQQTFTQELRGIPEWVLAEYFEKLGAVRQSDGSFSAPGWAVSLTRLPDHQVLMMKFCCYRVVFQGEAQAVKTAWDRFQLKILRPGG